MRYPDRHHLVDIVHLCMCTRTREETEALVEGVEHCGGAGHWQDIKRLGYPAIAARSAVDLKDKWRNLLRIAELPPELVRCIPGVTCCVTPTYRRDSSAGTFLDPLDHHHVALAKL